MFNYGQNLEKKILIIRIRNYGCLRAYYILYSHAYKVAGKETYGQIGLCDLCCIDFRLSFLVLVPLRPAETTLLAVISVCFIATVTMRSLKL
jgi:hypothetical protein